MSLPAVPLAGVAMVAGCAVIEGFAQVFFKKSALAGARGRPWVLLGAAFFTAEVLLYTNALRFVDLSIAYPLGALSFVAVALLSQWFLRERIDRNRWTGVLLILAGAALVVVRG